MDREVEDLRGRVGELERGRRKIGELIVWMSERIDVIESAVASLENKAAQHNKVDPSSNR